jgi:hypothetical protein
LASGGLAGRGAELLGFSPPLWAKGPLVREV